MNKIEISVVTPVYRAADCLEELHHRLTANLTKITSDYEIIMVNDACPQNSWAKIEQLASTDDNLVGIHLSRNFGQHIAIACGINHTRGRYVIVMDCDLQDNPEEIENFYNKVQEGYDIVYGRRIARQNSFFKRMTSRCFYLLLNLLSGERIDGSIGNYSIISSKVVEAMQQMPEIHRSYPMLLHWLGFNTAKIDIQQHQRYAGKSSYNFLKMLRFAVHNIVSFSDKLLTISIYFGFFITFVSTVLVIKFLVTYWLYETPITGWTSLIVSLFFLGGIIIGSLGILGLYIGKMFAEMKRRPMYVVSKTVNDNTKNNNYEFNA